MRAVWLAVTCFASMMWAGGAEAYYVRIKGKPHERMTAAAVDCLAQNQGYPIKCPLPTAERPLNKQKLRGRRYLRETRWPDDPTRQSSSAGLAKFLVNVGGDQCLKYVGTERFAGLMCNSHYGTLQFLHAMSADAGSEDLEPTRTKILEWTALAFRVATGEVPASASFCSTVRQYGSAGVALAPAEFPYCAEWTMASLFGQTCSNVFNSATCRQNNSNVLIRRSALGALLHLIQDSYSRSHSGRGERAPNGPFDQAMVRCQPVQAFYRYSLEQKVNHPKADLEPEFSPECSGTDAGDPITASARIIWLVENGCDASWATALVDAGVIGNRPVRIPTAAECRTAISGQTAS